MAPIPRNITVSLTLDPSRFDAALRRLNRSMAEVGLAFQRMGRQGWRMQLTPGERHIDRVCREVAGQPEAALKLFVAAGCVAPVLDREA